MDVNDLSDASPRPALTAAQAGIIDYFSDLAGRFALPRSAGQIFGLLFGHSHPLPFDRIVETLGISKGAASVSLKLLRQLKAVHVRHELGDRRTFYEAETSLRHLLGNFLEDGVRPHLRDSAQRLDAIADQLRDGDGPASETALIEKRLASLRTWHHKAQRLLPWIARLTLPRKGHEPD